MRAGKTRARRIETAFEARETGRSSALTARVREAPGQRERALGGLEEAGAGRLAEAREVREALAEDDVRPGGVDGRGGRVAQELPEELEPARGLGGVVGRDEGREGQRPRTRAAQEDAGRGLEERVARRARLGEVERRRLVRVVRHEGRPGLRVLRREAARG